MRDKWRDYQVMGGEETLHKYLPETQLLTKRSLWEFMNRYNQVIIKPRHGYRGLGVSTISSLDKDLFEIHIENRKITLTDREEVYDYLKDLQKSHYYNRYIVQQRIPLATIDDCPFDLRVMVQRKRGSSNWVVTGKAAKVAAENFLVTNVAQNVLPVEEAIQNSTLCHIQHQSLLPEIDNIGIQAATKLNPKYRTVGFDIGIDHNGKIWIIEANFNPVISIFDLLIDKMMYETIKKFKKG
ncbi:YheC/YheD family protein [Lederbergia citrea]|uniref:YheC/YheD family protein n=1 Tax=Lederbergia citrea TaxID=2833581 RepID=A0A942UND9_9BACI|nr:YheC/YheD family protein [Lederbergia citrea]MBS4179337.1 YheC/YheD family protein [Lederbergia citrea]MBS4206006.1 YheC/YheD family protein [Lederbergia citrea]MBS4224545.1 YheC/YheD family protein [Lederbergia citrea]